jgi:hypothetical protein
MPVVERDVKAVQIARPFGGDPGHQALGREAFGFGLEHDGRAMGVVGAHEVHLVALHALEPHPDVGLDVLHDVADMERAIGIGQGGGDEQRRGAMRGSQSRKTVWRTRHGNKAPC